MDVVEKVSFQPQRTDSDRYPAVIMSKEDALRARSGETERGIHILGFQSVASLKDYHQLRPSLFVYPDEHSLKISTTIFIALHDAMLQSECLAICRYIKTPNTQPRMAALLPQQEIQDQDGLQVMMPADACGYLPVGPSSWFSPDCASFHG